MTTVEKEIVLREYIGTAAYFRDQIPDVALKMYLEDLEDLSVMEILTAMKGLRRDPKTKRTPLPSEIRNKINSSNETPEDAGRDVAARIIDAGARYGNNNFLKAKEMIGELGWYVVSRLGGWERVCENITSETINHYYAQIRDLAATYHRKALNGNLYEAPKIPQLENNTKNLLQLSFKEMPRGSDETL